MPTSSGGGGGGGMSYSSRRTTGRPLPATPIDTRLLSKRSPAGGSPLYSSRHQSSSLYGAGATQTVSQRTKQMLTPNYTDYTSPSTKITRAYDLDTNNNYSSSGRSHAYTTNNRGSDYIYSTPSSKAYGSHYEREKYDQPKNETTSRYSSTASSQLTNKYGSTDRISSQSLKPSYTVSGYHGSLSKLSSRSNSVDSIKSNSTPTRRERERDSLATQNRNESCSSFDPDTAVAEPRGSRSDKGNVGLSNLGNTCFMNSVLQCLLNTKALIDYVTSSNQAADINKTTSSMKGALMEAYAGLVRKVWVDETKQSVVSPSELKRKVERFAPRFGGYNQQDAQEFLRYLLQGLHEDVNRVKSKPKYIGADDEKEDRMSDSEKAREYWSRYINFDNSHIVDLFVGQLKSTLICQTCGYKSVTFDPFWDLSLPIPKNRSEVRISDCLDSFMKEEVLDGDERPTCAKCKAHRKCTKTFSIQRFPKILVLHLKRFSGERYRSKLSTKVNFDLRGLDLSKFTVENGPVSYNLYGISNHVGSVYSGHYTAYCRHPYKKKWYSFNDTRVNSVSESSLVSEEAYVLFYERD